MATSDAHTPRERYRAQVRAEITGRAWEQIATAGASALSLNAIAKQMGMSGPALYRYFASRDDLMTELVREAYRSLAETLRAAAANGAGLAALAHVLRDWALADPQRYFLVYGTPVPGYQAPADITAITAISAISAEIMTTLLDACTAHASGDAATPFDAYLEGHRGWAAGHPAPPAALHRFLALWTRLHGVLSLELAGHFAGMDLDPARLFAAELDDLLTPRA
ncbi:TetR/AcrR family transcriptional regulator [Kitasatospora sp. NBC_01560]|uniref:TetR/AcrR family transcriptional regulator n=1 Tax=Kitasatospora sp. NBC_01560 TaxID=2975965 RepID=UPI0038696D7E